MPSNKSLFGKLRLRLSNAGDGSSAATSSSTTTAAPTGDRRETHEANAKIRPQTIYDRSIIEQSILRTAVRQDSGHHRFWSGFKQDISSDFSDTLYFEPGVGTYYSFPVEFFPSDDDSDPIDNLGNLEKYSTELTQACVSFQEMREITDGISRLCDTIHALLRSGKGRFEEEVKLSGGNGDTRVRTTVRRTLSTVADGHQAFKVRFEVYDDLQVRKVRHEAARKRAEEEAKKKEDETTAGAQTNG